MLKCALSAAAAVLLALGGLVLAGCGPQGYAAESNLRLSEREQQERRVLDRGDQRRVIAAMKSVAADHTPVNPPAPAPKGVRWSDVEPAARLAATESDMGVFGIEREDGRIIFHLRTVGDRPGRLSVTRTNDDRVYEAEATVGRFGDRTDMAERLLSEFDDAMQAFGAKRQFNEELD